jgi:hypothetical protein
MLLKHKEKEITKLGLLLTMSVKSNVVQGILTDHYFVDPLLYIMKQRSPTPEAL